VAGKAQDHGEVTRRFHRPRRHGPEITLLHPKATSQCEGQGPFGGEVHPAWIFQLPDGRRAKRSLTQFRIDHLQFAVAPEDQLSIRRQCRSARIELWKMCAPMD